MLLNQIQITFDNRDIILYLSNTELFMDVETLSSILRFASSKIHSLLNKDFKFFYQFEGTILSLVNYQGILHLAYSSPNRVFRTWCLTDLLTVFKSSSEIKNSLIFEENNSSSNNSNSNSNSNFNFDSNSNSNFDSNSVNQSLDSSILKKEESLKDLYLNNSCLLLKDNTYHDFLQRLIMKVVNQIPYIYWEEEISILNSFNPLVAKTRRFDLVEHQPNNKIIIWEIHTKPIDKAKVISTLFEKAYLKLARENYPYKNVFLTFTSPEGIDSSGQLCIDEMKYVNYVPYQDLLLHLFKMFRLLTPKQSQWRLKEEEAQIKQIIGNRQNSILNTHGYKGVIKDKKKYRVLLSYSGKRQHLGTFDCPLEAAIVYDNKVRELKLNKPLNFPYFNNLKTK